MTLSCSCECDDPDWWYYSPQDYTTLTTKRSRKCCSCGARINVGDLCVKFPRWRAPTTDIEERICGDEVPISSLFMCESCGDQFFNLNALGFCLDIEENMMDVLQEYRQMVAEERSRKHV